MTIPPPETNPVPTADEVVIDPLEFFIIEFVKESIPDRFTPSSKAGEFPICDNDGFRIIINEASLFEFIPVFGKTEPIFQVTSRLILL